MTQNKLREQLAKSFIDALSQDQLPWKACWSVSLPENATNGKKYRGINALMLSFVSAQTGMTDHRWCTFKQASEKGWHIRKGSKGALVEYWAYYDKEAKKLLPWKDAKRIMLDKPDYATKNLQLRSRTYTVFNGCQIEGIPPIEHTNSMTPDEILQKRDTLLQNMHLKLVEGGSQPYYAPETDTVHIPYAKDFIDGYAYSCTLLHECAHASGHSSRLNRDLSGGFGTADYAREELRAEISSALSCQALGLHLSDAQLQMHMDLHKAYIQSWAKTLQNAPEELFRAIKAAEGISDYIIEKGEFLKDRANEIQKQDSLEYAGRIDHLDFKGNVVESMEYRNPDDLIRDIKDAADCGMPVSLTLYTDSNGKTINTDFLRDLEQPFMQFRREPRNVKPVRTVEQDAAMAQRIAKSIPSPARAAHSHERER